MEQKYFTAPGILNEASESFYWEPYSYLYLNIQSEKQWALQANPPALRSLAMQVFQLSSPELGELFAPAQGHGIWYTPDPGDLEAGSAEMTIINAEAQELLLPPIRVESEEETSLQWEEGSCFAARLWRKKLEIQANPAGLRSMAWHLLWMADSEDVQEIYYVLPDQGELRISLVHVHGRL